MASTGLDLAAVVHDVFSAPTREEAAKHMLRRLGEHIAGGAGRVPKMTVVRSYFHLQRDGVYESETMVAPADDTARPRLSRTAIGQVEKHYSPVVIDVQGQRASPIRGPRGGLLSDRSMMGFVERQATHAIALPGHTRHAELRALLSFEVQCRGLRGRGPDAWAPLLEDLAPAAVALTALVLSRPVEGRTAPAPGGGFAGLPAVGPAMRGAVDMLSRVAPTEHAVLLIGETGTGKGFLARGVHAASARRDKPFVSVNIGGMSQELVESQLFGHAKGAFTGAHADQAGLVESARGGTLFIDEVHHLSHHAQVSLLRLLDEGRFRRVGEVKDRFADVRFVFAAGAALLEEVRQGRFLPDLYYRMADFPVRVAPLRERLDEIDEWVDRFLDEEATAESPRLASPSADALHLLRGHGWSGNLRQLRQVVRRAAFHASGSVAPGDDVALWRRALGVPDVARQPGRGGVVTLLQQAAEAWVADVQRPVARRKVPLEQDPGRVFYSAVVCTAVDTHPSPEAACERLGFSTASRNHRKKLTEAQEWWTGFQLWVRNQA